MEKATPGLLENSNSKKRSRGLEDSMEDSIEDDSDSGSRTKTVSFSQHSYSEEACKLSQHLQQLLGIVTKQRSSREEVKQPPDFEKIDSNQRNDLVFGANPLKDGEF